MLRNICRAVKDNLDLQEKKDPEDSQDQLVHEDLTVFLVILVQEDQLDSPEDPVSLELQDQKVCREIKEARVSLD